MVPHPAPSYISCMSCSRLPAALTVFTRNRCVQGYNARQGMPPAFHEMASCCRLLSARYFGTGDFAWHPSRTCLLKYFQGFGGINITSGTVCVFSTFAVNLSKIILLEIVRPARPKSNIAPNFDIRICSSRRRSFIAAPAKICRKPPRHRLFP